MPRVVEGFHPSKSHPGARLYHQSWHPDFDDAATPPRAAVVWAHGVHEHSGRFVKLYEHLAASGIASHAWDHVGHGASDACPPGVPHQFPNGLNAVVDDAARYFGRVRRMYPPDVPVMLAGVSMGGLVATLAVLDAGISPDALILVAPLVDVDMSAAMKAQAAVGGLLARAVPNARITPGVEPRRLSKDADAVREYVEDPRVFVGNLRVGLGYELLKGFARMRRRWSEVRTPLLVLHGTDDEATDPRASRRFFDAATSADKKFVSLKGACHLICHEAGASRRVMDEVLAFVSSRAGNGGSTGREWAAEAGSRASAAAGGSAGRGGGTSGRAAGVSNVRTRTAGVRSGEHAFAARAARL